MVLPDVTPSLQARLGGQGRSSPESCPENSQLIVADSVPVEKPLKTRVGGLSRQLGTGCPFCAKRDRLNSRGVAPVELVAL